MKNATHILQQSMTTKSCVRKLQSYGRSKIMLPFCLNISTVKAVVWMGLKLYTVIAFAAFASVR